MAGYSKLFSSIITSTIWCEDNATRIVWIAMLATCDAYGKVEGSIPGFASLARVSVDEMRFAIGRLSSPDPESRTPDNEGRRISSIPGGWQILNYSNYRERLQEKDGSKARAMRESRERRRVTTGNALPKVTLPASAYASVPGTESISRNTDRGDTTDWAGPVNPDGVA
jgi:hypothetical protein